MFSSRISSGRCQTGPYYGSAILAEEPVGSIVGSQAVVTSELTIWPELYAYLAASEVAPPYPCRARSCAHSRHQAGPLLTSKTGLVLPSAAGQRAKVCILNRWQPA